MNPQSNGVVPDGVKDMAMQWHETGIRNLHDKLGKTGTIQKKRGGTSLQLAEGHIQFTDEGSGLAEMEGTLRFERMELSFRSNGNARDQKVTIKSIGNFGAMHTCDVSNLRAALDTASLFHDAFRQHAPNGNGKQ